MIGLTLSFLALAASAVATGYLDGHEYVYKYSGVVYTGYPRIKPQESGYVYNVRLIIQPHGDQAVFKVDQVHKAQFNGEFEDVLKAPHNFVPLPSHAEFLTRPFRVHRKNGIVTNFEVTRNEPSFSVNLKRGIISLFNLNFDHVEAGVSTDENDILKPAPDAHYYKLFEDTMVGECETAYVIEHHPYDRSNNIVLNVTKVRNFHNCKTRPTQVYSTFHGYECGEVEHEKSHTLHGNAHYHYSIRGDRHHYVIEKIRSESDVAYTPYPLEGQTVATTIKRSFELIEEKPVTTPLQISDDLETFSSVTYDFDYQKDFKDPVDLKKPHYLFHLTGRKVPISDIKKQVDELINVYNDETYAEKFKDKNFPAKFVELLRSVGTLGYEEIEDLYKTYADIPRTGATPQQKAYRHLFLDTLVNLGTNPAFAFGKYLIESNKVRKEEALYFIQQLQFHLKEASEVLFDNLQELCENENVKKHPTLHVPCVTTLSNVVFEHCVVHFHPEGEVPRTKNTCPYDTASKYFNYIARLYDTTRSEKLKMAYVRAAGNIGVKEIFPYLTPYIEGHGNRKQVYRDNAVWALKNVGYRYPDKARHLLVPLLFNRTEDHKLRLAAFVLLMHYRPKLYEIEGVARALKYDTDDQVKSFVYSTFKALANSTHPCDRKISKDAHYALRILEEGHNQFEHYDYSYSHQHYVAGYDSDYDYGGSTRFAYFANNNGYIPESVYFGVEDFIGGKLLPTLGVGFKQHGLEKFVDKIFGPEGSFGKRSLFDLFKKRNKRDTSAVKKELNEINSKLNFPVHEYGPMYGEIFSKYMGNHLNYYQFDDKFFESFFNEGRFVIPNIPAYLQNIPSFKYQRFLLSVDKFYVLPSESGIPIVFDYKQPIYFYHNNKKSSFRVEPGFFPEDRGGQWPEHVIAETDGHIGVDKHLIAYMGLIIPFDQVFFGAGINRRVTVSLPLKLKLDLVVAEKKLKTHWTPVAPHEIYHFKYEPFTFIDSYGNSVPLPLEDGYRPVHRVHRHEVEKHFFHDALGVGFDVHADYENEFNDFGSWVDFLVKKNYREKFYYLFSNPKFEPYHVDIRFSHAKEAATREVDFAVTYQFFDEDWVNPHFSEENFEDFSKQTDGRGPLCTCVLKADLLATGDKERKIHSVLAWTRDLIRSFHKVNLFYERSPFTSHETESLKVCGSSYLKYPKYDHGKLLALDTVNMDHTVKSELKTHFGKSCDSDQKVQVQGLITESEEQHDFETRRDEPDTPEHYNEYSHYYQECKKERAKGINFGDACFEYLDLVTTLHKYSFHIKYDNLAPATLNTTKLLNRIVRFLFYTHSDQNELDVHNPAGETDIVANFSMKLPVGDIRMRKPEGNYNFYNIYLPWYVGFSSYPVFEEMHIKNSLSDTYCKVEQDNVFTFDRFEYDLPPIDCYTVIAKDCSPNQLFTVLATKIKHPKYHRAIKIFLGDHKVEALPVSDDSGIIVRVDGTRVPLAVNEPYIHKEGDSHVPEFYVTFRDAYYALHSEQYGLIVEYDGHAVMVQVSPFYRAKLCGLCGNYNGQKHDGSTNAEGCHYKDEKAFAYFNTVPSDTCSVPQPEFVCPSEDGFGCTKLRTSYLEVAIGKNSRTCFSTEPVAECSSHCQASGTIQRKLSFHCLPTKDDSTKALLRESETRILHELSRKSKDYETTLQVPSSCVRT